jgi:hypothetical protein
VKVRTHRARPAAGTVSLRAAALAGMIGPVVFWGVLILVGLARPGYNPAGSQISVLALGVNGWVQTASFVVFGLLILVFQAGLLRAVAPGNAWRLLNVLAISPGLALISLAVFPTDRTGGLWTVHGEIHLGVVGAMAILLPLSCLAAAQEMKSNHAWRGYARFSVLIGAATSACAVALLLVWIGWWPASHPWLGLYERAAFALPCVWMEVIAIRLLRLS